MFLPLFYVSMYMRLVLLAMLLVLLSGHHVYAKGVYQEPDDFLNDSFANDIPKPELVWLTSEIRPAVEKILGHKPDTLRIRYWKRDAKSAWILEEIGKEKPITTGIVIKHGKIERVKVLVFRESRGWEVRHAFFTDQFKDAQLDSDKRLNKSIDGISGATLSVRALKKLSRVALLLDQYVRDQK